MSQQQSNTGSNSQGQKQSISPADRAKAFERRLAANLRAASTISKPSKEYKLPSPQDELARLTSTYRNQPPPNTSLPSRLDPYLRSDEASTPYARAVGGHTSRRLAYPEANGFYDEGSPADVQRTRFLKQQLEADLINMGRARNEGNVQLQQPDVMAGGTNGVAAGGVVEEAW